MQTTDDAPRPDFAEGIPAASLKDGGMLVGRFKEAEVLLVRRGDEFFAVGASCTHYHGPLGEGLVVGDTVRCPLHHACFSLRTGEALRAPALDPISCWRVEQRGGRVFVTGKQKPTHSKAATPPKVMAESVVIVGGGAAGLAAADMLRRDGYAGALTMVSKDAAGPVDRPNLSKDYLAGEAQEDWIPLRDAAFYADNRIDLKLNTRAVAIDSKARTIGLEDGTRLPYGTLLLATGAEPVRLTIPGADAARVFTLRTFADSQAIIAAAPPRARVVVIGASFIGLEVAASLRTRGLAVDVVAPDKLPLERVMGPEIGTLVRALHQSHGVAFHLGETVAGMSDRRVTLSGGSTLDADLVVVGVGVRPALELAEAAGLAIDRGITVNEYLETSVAGIYAAGDIARWRDRATGERRRVEHWVVAERQGQVAAKNIMGGRVPFDAAPFFWSQHYDVTIRYVGYAEKWDAIEIDGDVTARDCAVSFKRGGKTVAVATIGRDLSSLQAELNLEGAG